MTGTDVWLYVCGCVCVCVWVERQAEGAGLSEHVLGTHVQW